MTNSTHKLDNAKWLFERTLGWIATADVKVGVAVAIDTALLGGLAAAFGASDPHLRTAWTYLTIIAAGFGMIVAIFCAGMAAIPRMLGPVKSSIYFARIAEKTEADYAADFVQIDEQAFLSDLAIQIHRNAQIATAKHSWVRKSLLWSFLAAVPWIAAIALLVKT